jgi:hypothetical protein
MASTRKNKHRKGGGLFNKKGPVPAAQAAQTAEKTLQRESAVARSNMGSLFSQGVSRNKAKAKAKYNATMKLIEEREGEQKPISQLKQWVNETKEALNSAEMTQAKAITLTIPVGLAQIIVKALMLFIAFLLFVFVEIPSMGSFPISQYFLPDSGFETTEAAYTRLQETFRAPS